MCLRLTYIFLLITLFGLPVNGQSLPPDQQLKLIMNQDKLVAFWDFSNLNDKGMASNAGRGTFYLTKVGNVKQEYEGPLSGRSVRFDGKTGYLTLLHSLSGDLDITSSKVTVVAWVKWEGGIGFVAGKWNEHDSGGRRQYGLFVSLPHYNGGDQVCGHISRNGGPTDPFPYSIDYSASNQRVPKEEWVCVAFTYDGEYIKSYLNGVFEGREPELIDNTAGFLNDKPDGIIQQKNPYFYPYGIGNNQSDFTVGSVELKSGMGNFFKGQIGGLAVFDDALPEDVMAEVAVMPL